MVTLQQAEAQAAAAAVACVWARAEQLLGGTSAVELCQAVWSAVSLGVCLSLEWSFAVNSRVASQMHELSPGDMCLLLWCLAHGAMRAKPLLHKQLLLHSHRLLLAGRFRPRDFTAFVWGYARVFGSSSALPRAWAVAFCAAASSQLEGFSARQLGVTLNGLLLLGAAVDRQLVERAALLVELRSACLSKAELARLTSLLLQLQQYVITMPAEQSVFGRASLGFERVSSGNAEARRRVTATL